MTMVHTVGGPRRAADLGPTYPHEHVLTAPPPWRAAEDPDYVLQSEDKIVEELAAFYDAGGRTIVDATSIDYGRDVRRLAKVQARTPVNIVCITGFNRGDFVDESVLNSSVEELAEHIIDEAIHGIDGTGIRPGAVKLGTSQNHIKPVEEKFIFAAARANRETGIPILTHTTRGTMAPEQLDSLKRCGADVSKVAVSHIDQNLDRWIHRQVLRQGAYLLYDGWSKVKYHPDSARISLLKDFVDEGFEDQILISGDMGRASYLTAYGGGPGFSFLLTSLRSRLLDEGWSEDLLHKLFVANPARWLSSEG